MPGHIQPSQENSSMVAGKKMSETTERREPAVEASPIYAYVGAYTDHKHNGHGVGLEVFRVNPVSGQFSHIQTVKEVVDPSFLVLDGEERFLYCVHESLDQVSAFSIDQPSGKLAWLNTQPTGGSTPASLSLDPTNRFLLVGNYMGGSVAVLPVKPDGKLGPISDLTILQGQPGPDKVEQAVSHPHDICFDPAGRYVMVPDKGFDRIFFLI